MSRLLVIELDDINSVPKVFYKGEEVTNKLNVEFSWSTKTDKIGYGSPFIDIEHFVMDGDKPYSKSIRYNGYFRDGESVE